MVVAATTAPESLAGQRGQVTGPRDRVQRPAAAGASSIAGRVFDAATNAPIPRAQVQALSDERIVDAITDEQGRYQLAGLTAGEWRVTFSKAGYFTREVGQRRPFESPPPVRLGAQQRLVADIPLSRGGVIAGRVYDEAGEPLAGLRVRVYRGRMAGSQRRLETVGAADFTDDTGAYRIYGLPPGDYPGTTSLELSARLADGATELLLLVQNPSATWPTPYILKSPVRLRRGTELRFVTQWEASSSPARLTISRF